MASAGAKHTVQSTCINNQISPHKKHVASDIFRFPSYSVIKYGSGKLNLNLSLLLTSIRVTLCHD